MARTPAPVPSGLGSQFSVAEAVSNGVTRGRLRSRDLTIPFRGVRSAREESRGAEEHDEFVAALDEYRRRIRSYVPRMSPSEFFSHTTAAILWGLPARVRMDDPLQVSVLHPGRAPRSHGINGHQVQPSLARVTKATGIRVTSPASTWAMLGGMSSTRDLVALGDAIVRIPRGRYGVRGDAATALASLTELSSAASAGRRLGAARLREALHQIRVGSASPPESHLRLELVASGLPEPALDIDVFDTNGLYIGYTELAYPEWRVLIEYEGDHHRLDRTQWNRDIDKHARCVAAGWTVIRITADHLYHRPGEAARRVRVALEAAGWRPGRR